MRNTRGFTLIEILIVVGLIAILAAAVIVAINPGRQFSQTKNAQRTSNVNSILNAVGQYMTDNSGNSPSSITTTPTEICQTGATSCTNLANLSVLTNNEIYLKSIPVDPSASTTNGTGYQVYKSTSGRITIHALGAELEQDITISR